MSTATTQNSIIENTEEIVVTSALIQYHMEQARQMRAEAIADMFRSLKTSFSNILKHTNMTSNALKQC